VNRKTASQTGVPGKNVVAVVGRAGQSAGENAEYGDLAQPAGKGSWIFVLLDQPNEENHGGGDRFCHAFFEFAGRQTAESIAPYRFDGWQDVFQELILPAGNRMTDSIFNENTTHYGGSFKEGPPATRGAIGRRSLARELEQGPLQRLRNAKKRPSRG
jgi:hypothetical protein